MTYLNIITLKVKHKEKMKEATLTTTTTPCGRSLAGAAVSWKIITPRIAYSYILYLGGQGQVMD